MKFDNQISVIRINGPSTGEISACRCPVKRWQNKRSPDTTSGVAWYRLDTKIETGPYRTRLAVAPQRATSRPRRSGGEAAPAKPPSAGEAPARRAAPAKPPRRAKKQPPPRGRARSDIPEKIPAIFGGNPNFPSKKVPENGLFALFPRDFSMLQFCYKSPGTIDIPGGQPV